MKASWEAVVSGPSKLSLESYIQDYQRQGYEVDLRHESDGYRLYVRRPYLYF